MCCIIHRKVGDNEIKTEYLEMILRINDDGWGCSYINNGKIITKKSMEMPKAIDYIRKLEKKNVEFLFHARYTTLGKTDINNCHPYDVENGVMFHNGQISGEYWNKDFSDSWHFAITITKFLQRKFNLDAILEKFKDRIGESRLAFLFKDGTILKYGKWHDVDGVSYSKINWKNRINNNYDYYGYMYEQYLDEYKQKENYSVSQNKYSPYQLAIKSCQETLIYPSMLRKLTQEEIGMLMLKFPDLFADYIYNRARRQ